MYLEDNNYVNVIWNETVWYVSRKTVYGALIMESVTDHNNESWVILVINEKIILSRKLSLMI